MLSLVGRCIRRWVTTIWWSAVELPVTAAVEPVADPLARGGGDRGGAGEPGEGVWGAKIRCALREIGDLQAGREFWHPTPKRLGQREIEGSLTAPGRTHDSDGLDKQLERLEIMRRRWRQSFSSMRARRVTRP